MADFKDEILATLGGSPEEIERGRLQRFSTNGKRSDLSGWCRLFEDGRAGVYGCFRQGVSEVWTDVAPERLTAKERVAVRVKVAEARAQREREQQAQWRQNFDRIASLWRQSEAVSVGDPVHRYLSQRLAVQPLVVPSCLRLSRAMPYVHEGELIGAWPAMVAPLMSRAGKALALHRTYLTPEGRKADVPGPVRKLTPAAGLLAGAAIPLHEPDSGRLGIAEGIETALAAMLGSGVPTVAAYSAGNLAKWQWPIGLETLVAFTDADAPGRAAAAELRARALHAGLKCAVLAPAQEGTDWCDHWAARHIAQELAA